MALSLVSDTDHTGTTPGSYNIYTTPSTTSALFIATIVAFPVTNSDLPSLRLRVEASLDPPGNLFQDYIFVRTWQLPYVSTNTRELFTPPIAIKGAATFSAVVVGGDVDFRVHIYRLS